MLRVLEPVDLRSNSLCIFNQLCDPGQIINLSGPEFLYLQKEVVEMISKLSFGVNTLRCFDASLSASKSF